MEYMLTKDDIAKLVAAGLPGAMEGEIATPEDLQALGVTPQDTPEAPAITDDRSPGGNLAVEAMPAAPAVTAAAPVASDANILQQLLAPQAAPTTPTDPYENLSKTQRRMLAFAGLSDAGAALQGGKGGNVSAMLGRFNEQADMQRKATAAQQRTQLLGGLGLGAGVGAGDSAARRQAILGAAAQGLIDGPTAKLMIEELERQKTQGTEISGKAALIARIDALMNDPNLEDALGFEGIVRGFASNVGLDPNVARVNEMIKQIRGDVFLQAFEKLKGGGQITELEGIKAEQAMARLGQMQGYDDYVNALKELRFYVDLFSRRMQGESIPDETIYTPGQDPQGGNSDPLNIL